VADKIYHKLYPLFAEVFYSGPLSRTETFLILFQ
jgi:hypothetical protein